MSEAASPMMQADINTLPTMANCGSVTPTTPLKVKRKAKESNDDDAPDDGIVTPPRPQAAQPQPTPQTKPKPKRAKNAAASEPVQIRNGRLAVKQKQVDFTNEMSVLSGIMGFNAWCKQRSSSPVEAVPDEHLPVIARLTQESDKLLGELALLIKGRVLPAVAGQAEDGVELLPATVIESAILKLADRINYGLGASDVASSSSATTSTSDADIPAGLQMWRWEVLDDALLQPERVAELLSRREERKAVRQRALQLYNDLSQQERDDLLSSKKKAARTSKAKADGTSTRVSASSTASGSAIKPGSVEDATTENAAGGETKLPVAETDDSVIVLDHDDEDDEQAKQSHNDSLSPGRTREASSNGPSKKPSQKKEETLTSEQQAEKLRKEQEREERRRQKEAKEAKKQKMLEQNKKAASLMSGFFAKPASPSTKVTPQQPVSTVSDFDKTFLPVAYKELAPINRLAKSTSAAAIDEALASTSQTSQQDLLAGIVKGTAKRRRRNGVRQSRSGIRPQVSVRETMQLVSESDLKTGVDAELETRRALEAIKDRKKVPVKLLQFATDMRPGWFGTWTRPSNMISGRRPLRQDPVALDYNYDSEAEWVQGEDDGKGEEVGLEDDDPEEAGSVSDGESEMADWLVDDLEEVEGEPEQDDAMSDIIETDPLGFPLGAASSDPLRQQMATPTKKLPLPGSSSTGKRTLPLPGLMNRNAKAKKKKRVKNSRRFTQKLVPVILGPHWEEALSEPSHPTFAGYQMEFLNDADPGLDPFTFVAGELQADQTAQAPVNPSTAGDATPSRPSTGGTRFGSSTAGSTPAAPTATASASANASAETTPQQQLQSTPQRPTVPIEYLGSILSAIEGSTDTKALLVERLALQFKGTRGVTKVAIAGTIGQAAERERVPNAEAAAGSSSSSSSSSSSAGATPASRPKGECPWRVKREWKEKAGMV